MSFNLILISLCPMGVLRNSISRCLGSWTITIDWSHYNLIYCFPPFNLIGKVLQFIQESKKNSHLSLPSLANAVLVSTPASVNEISTGKNQDAQEDSNIASSTRGNSPSVPQTSASWMSCLQSSLINQGVTGEPLNTILESWRSGTRKQ